MVILVTSAVLEVKKLSNLQIFKTKTIELNCKIYGTNQSFEYLYSSIITIVTIVTIVISLALVDTS